MFSFKKAVVLIATFAAVFVGANAILGLLSARGFAFHYTPYWPVNVFDEAEQSWVYRLALGAALFAAFFVINRVLARKNYPLGFTILAGFALIVGSNLIQGWDTGFSGPIAEDEFLDEPAPQYYDDAIKITDPATFFTHYRDVQRGLGIHARTHPPGPVLLVYGLWKTLRDPALIAIAIAAMAVPLLAFFLYRLLLLQVPRATAGFATFLFLLLPAVQVYYLATVDAIIAGVLIGVFYCFVRGGAAHVAACIALLCVALLLTFVSVYIIPVLAGFELVRRRSLLKSTIVIGGVALLFVLICAATGYNEIETFRTASAIENDRGFTALHAPLDYAVSRIEDVAELTLFFGPFLCVVLWRAVDLKRIGASDLTASFLVALTALALMLLTGIFRVGETARALLFIYAFALLPIALYVDKQPLGTNAKTQLATLVFGQAILMQIAGNYFW